MTTPLAFWAHLRTTYWFVPSVVTIVSIGLAFALTTLERHYPGVSSLATWAYDGGAAGARGILSAVAGSMITVVSVTFSVTIVALTVSSQHFGPRLLNSFMRDTAAQLVLGTFIGTFAYCLVVLRTVQGDGDDVMRFVPHLAVTVAFVLTLISVGTLIYYVHHVSASLQVSEIAAAVAKDLESAIDRLYPERVGEPAADSVGAPPEPPEGAGRVTSDVSGYLQELDSERLLTLAVDHDVVIWMMAAPGSFLIEGSTIALVDPPPDDLEAFGQRLQALLVIGNDRTSQQDIGFAVQQLVEVALHALSPSMNEPFTAITCIDRLSQGLSRLAGRSMPDPHRQDPDGHLRVIAYPQSFEGTLRDAFGPIRRNARGDPAVLERLLQSLATLGGTSARAGDRAAIREEATQVYQTGLSDLEPPALPRFEARYRRLLEALDDPYDGI